MDEDQQQEGQQEEEQQEEQQKIAPAAFTSFNISPPPRRPISSFSLFNRQAVERDETISGAVRNNQIAITSINTSLVNITSQVVLLSNSLNQVAEKLQESSVLEKMKMAQEQRQQAMLADRNMRRGQENNIERGIQAALFAPVQRIGAKTRFTLGRLVTFFNILLGGFVAGRAIKLIEALIKGDQEALKNIGDTILKQLTAAGGIFLAINGGLIIALRSLTRLASFLTQVAVSNLLLKPIRLIFGIAKGAAALIGTGLAGGALATSAIPTNTRVSNLRKGRLLSKTRAFSSVATSVLVAESERRSGTPALEAYGRNSIFAGISIGGNILGNALQKNPKTALLGSIISSVSSIAPLAPLALGIGEQSVGLNAITGNVSGSIDESIDKIRTNNINVVTQPRMQSPAPMSAEGRAALLMFAPPSNPDNPYLLNSHIQYNVIPV